MGHRYGTDCAVLLQLLALQLMIVLPEPKRKPGREMQALVIVLFALAAGMLVGATAWAAKNPAAVRKNKPHFHMAAGTQDAMKRSVKPSGNKPGIAQPSGGVRRYASVSLAS